MSLWWKFDSEKGKKGTTGIRTRIIWVEAQCPSHITKRSERTAFKKLDGEWFMKLWNWQENDLIKTLTRKKIKKKSDKKFLKYNFE